MSLIPSIISSDHRQYAIATARNREPILAVLQRILPETGLLLEIAAGSGQHAAYFAPYFPKLTWQPSEPNLESRASIAAWVVHANAGNLNLPIDLDVSTDPWPISKANAIFSSNLIHIAPWDCCLRLMAGAGQILEPQGVLILYGPFIRNDKQTAPSNIHFDISLKQRNPCWGIRDLDQVTKVAKSCGLDFSEIVEMPSNNLTIILKKQI